MSAALQLDPNNESIKENIRVCQLISSLLVLALNILYFLLSHPVINYDVNHRLLSKNCQESIFVQTNVRYYPSFTLQCVISFSQILIVHSILSVVQHQKLLNNLVLIFPEAYMNSIFHSQWILSMCDLAEIIAYYIHYIHKLGRNPLKFGLLVSLWVGW